MRYSEFENIITQKVKGGLYNSASEVVREGLRLLQERDALREAKLASLRAEVQMGIDDLEAGRHRDGRAVMADIHEMLLKKQRPDG